jgi:hypothetical protein
LIIYFFLLRQFVLEAQFECTLIIRSHGLVATIMLPSQVREMCWELFKVHQPMEGMCTMEWQKCVPSFVDGSDIR